ncbi:hypothetical protein KUA25_06175 [Bacteroidales bacterium MSK.15.36]|nr:hypothetical protein [Bacteroidales bacterium MSK.15.36]
MAGTIEIQKYVPPFLLKGKDVGDMDFDEFLEYLAMARYVQELEKENIMRAISEVLSEE